MPLKVVTVATSWGSEHGGVNAFNYQLTSALTKLGHTVTCLVKSATDKDFENSGTTQLKSALLENTEKWTAADAISLASEIEHFLKADLLIVHDLLSYQVAKRFIENQSKRPLIASFIHTWYKETDYFSEFNDEEREGKVREQIEIVESSDFVFTSGSWIQEKLLKVLSRGKMVQSSRIYSGQVGSASSKSAN